MYFLGDEGEGGEKEVETNLKNQVGVYFVRDWRDQVLRWGWEDVERSGWGVLDERRERTRDRGG